MAASVSSEGRVDPVIAYTDRIYPRVFQKKKHRRNVLHGLLVVSQQRLELIEQFISVKPLANLVHEYLNPFQKDREIMGSYFGDLRGKVQKRSNDCVKESWERIKILRKYGIENIEKIKSDPSLSFFNLEGNLSQQDASYHTFRLLTRYVHWSLVCEKDPALIGEYNEARLWFIEQKWVESPLKEKEFFSGPAGQPTKANEFSKGLKALMRAEGIQDVATRVRDGFSDFYGWMHIPSKEKAKKADSSED